MTGLDFWCYGCGTALVLDADASIALEDPHACSYCGAAVRFFSRPSDRKRLRDIATAPFFGNDDVDVETDDLQVDDSEIADEAEPDDAPAEGPLDPVGWDGAPAEEPVIDGVPLSFAVTFRHGAFLDSLVADALPPPILWPSDERHLRASTAIGRRYAEVLRDELQAAAPELRIKTHPRDPTEAGGPAAGRLPRARPLRWRDGGHHHRGGLSRDGDSVDDHS